MNGTRTVSLLFRIKRSSRTAIKAYVTVRVPQRRNPKQLHLGYVALFRESLPAGDRSKLLRSLQNHWRNEFGNDDVAIDWSATERKFLAARTMCADFRDST